MKNKMHTRYSFEVPNLGQVLLEPFKYANGRLGFIAVTENNNFNITLNMDEVEIDYLILKMYHEAEIVARHILKSTDLFNSINNVTVGINSGKVVKFNTK